jgi:hypothetical protein
MALQVTYFSVGFGDGDAGGCVGVAACAFGWTATCAFGAVGRVIVGFFENALSARARSSLNTGYGADCFLSAIEDAHGFFDGGGGDGVGACAFGWTATCAFGGAGRLSGGFFPIPPSKANVRGVAGFLSDIDFKLRAFSVAVASALVLSAGLLLALSAGPDDS